MKCTKCNTEFDPTPSLLSRRWYRCLDCRRPVMNRHRHKTKPETAARRYAQNRLDATWHKQAVARQKVRKALKMGVLARQRCSDCGAEKTDAHHSDYDKPLEVIWLCKSCHRQKHNPVLPPHSPSRALEVHRSAYRAASRRRWRDPIERAKKLARRRVQKAVAAGKIQKQPCAECGTLDVQAHHRDYANPFDIMWLCKVCHRKKH